MGCYHFHLNQLSRGKGQSAIASAAYRAGAKLECTYYGEVSDYTRKGGVVLAEIHLPKQAPERLKDRETLWNKFDACNDRDYRCVIEHFRKLRDLAD